MANVAKTEREWNRSQRHWYLKLLESLYSSLTWRDVFVGFCATVIISAILTGSRYQVIPQYKVGQIAEEEIRAVKDAQYEDASATALKRAEAEASVPAIYQLESDLISDHKKAISKAFSDARNLLAAKRITPQTKLMPDVEQELLKDLQARIGQALPPRVFPTLLRHYFSPILESRILKILETVLREGIIGDRGRFVKDLKTGVVIRDSSFPFAHPLTDAYLVRDLSAAREYLRQFHLDLSHLSQPDKTILMQYLETALFPTLAYNQKETESKRALAASQMPPVIVQIKRGQTIVHYGEQITPNLILQLDALRNLWRPHSLIWQFAGYCFFVAILIYSLWRYFVYYQVRHGKIRNHITLILVIILSELLVVRLATALADILNERFQRFHDPSILHYAIPFAFGALLTTLLVDVNLGIFSSIILATLTGLFYGDIDLAAYLIIGSLAGIYSIRQYKDRAAILKAGFTIGILNIFCLVALDFLRQNPPRFSEAVDQLALALLSGILASAFASMLLPALEYFFKIVTDIRLLELSNLNAPILRRLSVEAPGTYHHSLMVATLAEDAAESVGANPLLARVAAYYHDLGKMLKAEYFVENQPYGSNKHEELSPKMSCLIISSHVKDGLQLAKGIGLPQRITDMIPQHHGTRVMAYFFQKAKDTMDYKSTEIIDTDFRYLGPKPQSKEAAIIMMADSVEAASRTLSDPSPAQIHGMIDRLIDEIVDDNQFDECGITFRDVRLVKESFFKILIGIFHHRIDYPGYDFRRIDAESEKSAIPNPSPQQAKAN